MTTKKKAKKEQQKGKKTATPKKGASCAGSDYRITCTGCDHSFTLPSLLLKNALQVYREITLAAKKYGVDPTKMRFAGVESFTVTKQKGKTEKNKVVQ